MVPINCYVKQKKRVNTLSIFFIFKKKLFSETHEVVIWTNPFYCYCHFLLRDKLMSTNSHLRWNIAFTDDTYKSIWYIHPITNVIFVKSNRLILIRNQTKQTKTLTFLEKMSVTTRYVVTSAYFIIFKSYIILWKNILYNFKNRSKYINL